MIPTNPPDTNPPTPADDRPRFFVDDAIDPGADGDWWLDLGRVDLPTAAV